MKKLSRYFTIIAVATMLAMAQSVWAEDCCAKAAKAVKAGKACEKCLTDACCKETAKEVTKKGEAKTCEKCAKKGEKKPAA